MIENKNFNTEDYQKSTVKSAKNSISTNYLRKFKASHPIHKNNANLTQAQTNANQGTNQ